MKRLIVLLLISLSMLAYTTNAYSPSESWKKEVQRSNDTLNSILENKSLDYLKNILPRFKAAKENFENNKDINYAIWTRTNTIKEKINNFEIENKDKKKTEETQDSYKNSSFKESFFEEYWQDIVSDLEVSDRCTKYFDEIDEIAKKNDFPTSIIIATWYREYSCILWNPDNWWWPFQITSHSYEPWDISIEEFQDSIQDFIDFSKAKWNYYDNNPSLRERFGSESINIKYNEFTLRDLRLQSILYNWVLESTELKTNMYANTNLNENLSWARDWIVTKTLKIINWELENN